MKAVKAFSRNPSLHLACPDPAAIQQFDIVPGLQPVPFHHFGLHSTKRCMGINEVHPIRQGTGWGE
jgi:hypothetical protein